MKQINKVTKNYFKSSGTVSKWWNPEKGNYCFYYAKELKILDNQFTVNPNWKVLDMCTGKGRFAIYFAKKGCKVTAVDISEEMLSIAQGYAEKEGVSNSITFVMGDAENLSNVTGNYDVVCCMEALDHLPNVEKAIQEMSNKTKPNGHFMFTYVPESSLYWKYYLYIVLGRPEDLGIAKAYSTDYILNTLRKNNIATPTLFGVGLLFPTGSLISRAFFHVFARFETAVKDCYTHPSFTKRCAHIIGWGQRIQ